MLTNMDVIIRLTIGAFLGGIIGFERETHNKRIAGFRTHILVCVGATLIMLTSFYIFESCIKTSPIDPGRLAVGVITGIGFLGAGTIIRSGVSITGLTTAASLWTSAGIGLAVGCGFYIAAFATVIIVVIALYILRKIPIHEKG